jgi:hypothetical protein
MVGGVVLNFVARLGKHFSATNFSYRCNGIAVALFEDSVIVFQLYQVSHILVTCFAKLINMIPVPSCSKKSLMVYISRNTHSMD